MASNTPNLNLYKKDPTIDGNDTFNIKTMLNENWDKIDTEVAKKANKTEFNSHLTDSISHVTSAERTTWNGKAEKTYVDEQIQTVTATGIPKLVSYEYDLYATIDNQIVFTIPYDYFNSATDTLIVEVSGIDVPKSYYTVTNPVVRPDNSITKGYITLTEGRSKDSYLKMRILKNVPIGPDGAISGRVLATDSIPQDRVQGLVDLNNNFVSHKADDLYQTAGGTATAITLTIKGTLVTGYPINFIASANNNGAATTINGKPLYKPGTSSSPTLKAGKAYTVWYNASANSGNGCFFFKASATGTVTSDKVLAGETYSTEEDTDLVGVMANYTSQNIEASAPWNNGATLYFPIASGGYYPGAGASGVYRTDTNFIASNILNTATIFGLTGTAIPVVAGDYSIFNNSASYNSPSENLTKLKEIKVLIAGTYRIKCDVSTNYTSYSKPSYNSYQFYKNGTAISGAIFTPTANNTIVTISYDVALNANDTVQLYGWVSTKGTSYGYPAASNMQLCIGVPSYTYASAIQ